MTIVIDQAIDDGLVQSKIHGALGHTVDLFPSLLVGSTHVASQVALVGGLDLKHALVGWLHRKFLDQLADRRQFISTKIQ